MILQTLITVCLLVPSLGQYCLDPQGKPVAWWVVIKVPPKTGQNGYGYYDANTRTAQFSYISTPIDQGATPLTLTYQAINNLNMAHVAWNDEKPTGEIGSSLAHAKGLIAYSTS